jgi:hypothetical protein
MSDITETTDDKKPPSKRQKRQEVQAAKIYTTPPTPEDVVFMARDMKRQGKCNPDARLQVCLLPWSVCHPCRRVKGI